MFFDQQELFEYVVVSVVQLDEFHIVQNIENLETANIYQKCFLVESRNDYNKTSLTTGCQYPSDDSSLLHELVPSGLNTFQFSRSVYR